MASRKRDKFQRESDLAEIADMYLKGKPQSEIAQSLKVTQQQISYDLATIKRRWREQTAMNLDEAKNRELDRLDALEREYWDAWERSKKDRSRTQTEKRLGQNDMLIGGKATVNKEEMLGNPAYLAGIERCIDLRCKLLGIYAATKQEVSGGSGGPVSIRVVYSDDSKMF